MSLSTASLRKSYGASRALNGVSFSAASGRAHGLVGANGAGKSTLVKILSGAIRPDSGSLTVGDWTGSALTPRLAQHLGIATIYQDPGLAPTLGIAENILLGRERHRFGALLATGSQMSDVKDCLDHVGLTRPLRTPAGALTPADQQLLEIAKAVYRRASTVIMDEPTAALGDADRQRLFEVVRRMRSSGVSIIYVSHHLQEVIDLCDDVTVMRGGEVVLQASTHDTCVDDLVTAMIGHTIPPRKAEAQPLGEVALSCRGLSQAAGLHDVSFDVREGEVLGISGLVGSGRSRLARAIFGIEPIDAGTMTLYGRPYQPRSPREAVKRRVGLVPEDRKRDALLMFLSAGKNITLPRIPVRHLGWIRLRSEAGIAKKWIAQLGIHPPNPRTPPAAMSGGNQQKVVIARWIQAGSRLLILDEPGQGVDVGARDQILTAIRAAARGGAAVILISQEVEELQQIADRVLVMRKGRIVGEITRDDISEETVIPLAMGSMEHAPGKGSPV
ncbi:MAG: sugar ABC transporter ATP-binding protein [Candidatus Nanopelagicales bacterium]|nr:sugar ABC transporter ATP-binding protein [Candidatus Nanopelagicales bacterium]MCF8536373.1 sugar ABC transporter ATP-binding protein [Candidatus Nanopelagicales bacterium]MCF8541547.1 sugar ABC transporter ATP-binding protein [Candidatus Nanopelagicales bacterium]MCF8556534.1 sugar ABC transporter ATP-binding protein [Candidatus Nanopelagicales bacterium]